MSKCNQACKKVAFLMLPFTRHISKWRSTFSKGLRMGKFNKTSFILFYISIVCFIWNYLRDRKSPKYSRLVLSERYHCNRGTDSLIFSLIFCAKTCSIHLEHNCATTSQNLPIMTETIMKLWWISFLGAWILPGLWFVSITWPKSLEIIP